MSKVDCRATEACWNYFVRLQLVSIGFDYSQAALCQKKRHKVYINKRTAIVVNTVLKMLRNSSCLCAQATYLKQQSVFLVF